MSSQCILTNQKQKNKNKKPDCKQNTKLRKFNVEKKWKLTVEIKFLCPY